MDEVCVGLNPRGRGIRFAVYSSILSGWLTTGAAPCSARMCTSEQCDGDNRNCDNGQDNDGRQCEAERDEFTHVSIPFFYIFFTS